MMIAVFMECPMHRSTVYIGPTSPDAIGFTTGAGLPGDVRFDFKTISGVAYPNVSPLYPQMVLRPFRCGSELVLCGPQRDVDCRGHLYKLDFAYKRSHDDAATFPAIRYDLLFASAFGLLDTQCDRRRL
jgi:hypothetical protein